MADRLPAVRLRYQIVAFPIVRTVINTGFRLVYPFLPAIARGLGVSLETAALAVTARASLGFLAPVFGILADTRSRKSIMLLALCLYAAGLSLVAAWPSYAAFFLSLLLSDDRKIL